MKTYIYFTLFALVACALLFLCQQVRAQTADDTTNVIVGDTMYVAWAKTGWLPRTSALRNSIAGDTVAGGGRANANRVYKLKINGLYWEADDITNSGFTLRIVADPMDKIGTGNYPAIIQMKDTRDDGTTAALHILTAASDVILKNVFISGRTTANGSQTSYQPVLFNANNATYIIDGCIFEQSNFSLIVFGGKNCKCYVTNNKFRNLEENPPTQQWSGRGISVWTDEDTVVIENNTFFNIGFATFQVEGGSAKYFRYDHNTIVNSGRGLMSNSGNWWQSAYFANNLIINGWWEGEGYANIYASGRDTRQKHSGFLSIGILPAMYNTEESRRVVFTNTYAYLDPLIKAKYGTPDTIVRAYYIDDVSRLDYLEPYKIGGALGGHMYIGDTVWLTSLPTGMTNYLTDANWLKPKYTAVGATMVDSMWSFISQIRKGTTGGTTFFYHPTVNPSDETWPLPENFSYTDATLMTAGTDGLPIGDLNWFPTQKATFLANQAKYVAALDTFAGPVVIDSVKTTLEAEDGGLGGTAAVDKFTGFSYFYMAGGGYIQWDFDLTTAGQYGLNISTT